MEETYGVPVEEIQRGIKHGVRKINVDNGLPHGDHRRDPQDLREKPKAFDPREYLKPARDAMKATVMARMIAFGQAGQAAVQVVTGVRQIESRSKPRGCNPWAFVFYVSISFAVGISLNTAR